MDYLIYVNGVFYKEVRRKIEVYAFKREWKRKYPNDLVTYKKR